MFIHCPCQPTVHFVNIGYLIISFVGQKVRYTAPRHCYDKNAEKGNKVFCPDTLPEIINSFAYPLDFHSSFISGHLSIVTTAKHDDAKNSLSWQLRYDQSCWKPIAVAIGKVL